MHEGYGVLWARINVKTYDFRGPCCFAEYGKEIPFTLSYFSLDANTLSSL